MTIKPFFSVPFSIILKKPSELKAANGNARFADAKILGFSRASTETGFKLPYQIKKAKPASLKYTNDNFVSADKNQRHCQASTRKIRAAAESIEEALNFLR